MSQLLQMDSRNSNPVRRPVGGHFTGIPDDPVRYSVVPTNMSLPPAETSIDPRTGHPKSAEIHMEELRIDPNQPGIDRIIGGFGAQDSYRNHIGHPEVSGRTNVGLTEIPDRVGYPYVENVRNIGGLSALRAAANTFIPTAGVRKPIYGR